MAYEDLITLKELSPELRQLINTSGGTTIGGLVVVDDIYTKKVEATTEGQTEFEIPFEQYDSVNSYLDVKINSTWVNPDRYSIVGSKIVLVEGVSLGTVIYFTIFSLAEATPDGGFIEDVEMAETPQEVIVYDGNIIDEKVSAHNVSPEAHADIRKAVDACLKRNSNHLIENVDLVSALDSLELDKVYTLSNTVTGVPEAEFYNLILVGRDLSSLTLMLYGMWSQKAYYAYWFKPWGIDRIPWKEIATTETTTTLDNKIGDLSQRVFGTESGYNSAHLHKSYPKKYFSTIETEKDLDNIKYNLFCYTTAGDNLLNLPSGESGGQGMLEVKCSFAGGVVNHVQQRYTRTVYNRIYERQFNYDQNSWTDWQQIATTSKINNLSLLNGWTHRAGYGENNVIKTGNICTLTINAIGGATTLQTPICLLPSECRPKGHIVFCGSNNEDNPASFLINSNGSVYALKALSDNSKIGFSVTYSIT